MKVTLRISECGLRSPRSPRIPQSALRISQSALRIPQSALRIPQWLLLFVLTAAPARAAGFIAPFLGFSFGGDAANCPSLTNCEEKRMNWGASFGTTHGIFGFEQDIGYAPEFFGKTPGAENALLTVMSDFMVLVPAGPIQPYAIAGLGLIRPHATFNAAGLAVDKNALGYDVGGGINVYVQRHLGVRGDVRHMRTVHGVTLGLFSGDTLDFWRGSVGLTFRF